jgi:dihydroorotate dehydrogenase
MRRQACALVAVVAFLMTGSVAAAESAGEQRPRSLRSASRLQVLPAMLDNSPQAGRQATSGRIEVERRVRPSYNRPTPKVQIGRGSKAGKAANVLLAGFIGGSVGFFAGGFISPGIRCACQPEGFDAVIGAPIGAAVGAVLAATYVHRRQHP